MSSKVVVAQPTADEGPAAHSGNLHLRWNSRTTKEDFQAIGGLLFCGRYRCNRLIPGDLFQLKDERTGECYADCRICRCGWQASNVKKQAKLSMTIRADEQAFLLQTAKNMYDKDAEKGIRYDKTKFLDILITARAESDDKCALCARQIIFLAGSGAMQASKDRTKAGLPYSHGEQKIRWTCRMCNLLCEAYSEREVILLFQKFAATGCSRHLDEGEIAHIKSMRRNNYATEDRKMFKNCQRRGIEFVGETAAGQEMIAIAEESGSVCALSGVSGLWTRERHILKLGFDRILNFEGPMTRPTKKYAHSKDNIHVCLSAFNRARNQFQVEDLLSYIEHLRLGSVRKIGSPLLR